MKILEKEQNQIIKRGGKITRVREGDGVHLTGNIVHFDFRGLDCQAWGGDGKRTTWIVRDPFKNRRASCLSNIDELMTRVSTILKQK